MAPVCKCGLYACCAVLFEKVPQSPGPLVKIASFVAVA